MFARRRFLLSLVLALAAPAARAEEPLVIRITIKDHRFEPARVEVPAGKPIRLIVTNADPTPEEFESVGLKVERIIPPGRTTEFNLRPLIPGRNYKFFGEFNQATAQGELVVK